MFARWPFRTFTSIPSVGAVDVLAVLGVQEGRPIEILGVIGVEQLLYVSLRVASVPMLASPRELSRVRRYTGTRQSPSLPGTNFA